MRTGKTERLSSMEKRWTFTTLELSLLYISGFLLGASLLMGIWSIVQGKSFWGMGLMAIGMIINTLSTLKRSRKKELASSSIENPEAV